MGRKYLIVGPVTQDIPQLRLAGGNGRVQAGPGIYIGCTSFSSDAQNTGFLHGPC